MKGTLVAAFAILIGCGTPALAQSQDRSRSLPTRIARGDAEQMPYGDTSGRGSRKSQEKAMANYRTPASGYASTNGTDRIEMMGGRDHGRTPVGYRHFRRMCGWHHGQRACYRSIR